MPLPPCDHDEFGITECTRTDDAQRRRLERVVVPDDDSPESIKARKDAVESGHRPKPPGLSKLTKKQMAEMLVSIWTVADEMCVPRRNSSAQRYKLNIYGRVLAGFQGEGHNAKLTRGDERKEN